MQNEYTEVLLGTNRTKQELKGINKI